MMIINQQRLQKNKTLNIFLTLKISLQMANCSFLQKNAASSFFHFFFSILFLKEAAFYEPEQSKILKRHFLIEKNYFVQEFVAVNVKLTLLIHQAWWTFIKKSFYSKWLISFYYKHTN